MGLKDQLDILRTMWDPETKNLVYLARDPQGQEWTITVTPLRVELGNHLYDVKADSVVDRIQQLRDDYERQGSPHLVVTEATEDAYFKYANYKNVDSLTDTPTKRRQ